MSTETNEEWADRMCAAIEEIGRDIDREFDEMGARVRREVGHELLEEFVNRDGGTHDLTTLKTIQRVCGIEEG